MEDELDDKNAPSSTPDGGGSRRGFMIGGIGLLGAGLAGSVLGPTAVSLTHPLRAATTSGSDAFLPAGPLSRFGGDVPVKVDLFADKVDAWNRVVQVKVGSAWVVERGGELVAFSTVCPHLGCGIDYDDAKKKFLCPCHKSWFSLDGEVEEGPSPRAMDRLSLQTDHELVSIRYQRFKQGVERKEPLT